jgi:hypothetical protein
MRLKSRRCMREVQHACIASLTGQIFLMSSTVPEQQSACASPHNVHPDLRRSRIPLTHTPPPHITHALDAPSGVSGLPFQTSIAQANNCQLISPHLPGPPTPFPHLTTFLTLFAYCNADVSTACSGVIANPQENSIPAFPFFPPPRKEGWENPTSPASSLKSPNHSPTGPLGP